MSFCLFYPTEIKSREERSQQYFGTNLHTDSNLFDGMNEEPDITYDKVSKDLGVFRIFFYLRYEAKFNLAAFAT